MRTTLTRLVAVSGVWLACTMGTSAQTAAPPTEYAVIQQYADHYGTLSDEQATKLMRQWMDVDVAAAQLRAKYLPIVSQAIGGKKGATFAQLDRRVSLMIELQLASQVPLVQSQ